MDNFLQEYEKLNDDGRFYVDSALNAVLGQRSCLKETSEEELLEIRCKQEEEKKQKELEKQESEEDFAKLKSECNTMTKEDYISQFNEIFAKLPTYMLRYFFIIVKEAVRDMKGGVVNG